MRLRRNSQGDYVYEYVANMQDIENAQDELRKAQQEMYDFEKEQAQNTVDEIISLYSTMSEELVDMWKSVYDNSTEPTEDAIKELDDYIDSLKIQMKDLLKEFDENNSNLINAGLVINPNADVSTLGMSIPAPLAKMIAMFLDDETSLESLIGEFTGHLNDIKQQEQEQIDLAMENATGAGLDITGIISGLDGLPNKIVSSVIDVDKLRDTSEQQLTYLRELRTIANMIMKKYISSTGSELLDVWEDLYQTTPYDLPGSVERKMNRNDKAIGLANQAAENSRGSYEVDTTQVMFNQDEYTKYLDAWSEKMNAIVIEELNAAYGDVYAGLLSALQNTGIANVLKSISSLGTTPFDSIEQVVNINAEFPNVESSQEIQNAFMNLPNVAAQRLAVSES